MKNSDSDVSVYLYSRTLEMGQVSLKSINRSITLPAKPFCTIQGRFRKQRQTFRSAARDEFSDFDRLSLDKRYYEEASFNYR